MVSSDRDWIKYDNLIKRNNNHFYCISDWINLVTGEYRLFFTEYKVLTINYFVLSSGFVHLLEHCLFFSLAFTRPDPFLRINT